MGMSHNVAQMRIVRELREAEEALDTALLRQSSLLTTMLEARRDTDTDPFVGQEAMLRLTRSHQTACQCRQRSRARAFHPVEGAARRAGL